MGDTTFEGKTINIARDKGVATVAVERQAVERVADTAPEQFPDTVREQSADTLVEQTIDTALEQGADAAVEQGDDALQEEDGELGIGQIDLAARNAEIYRKCKEGYIHAQLSREYSLSPEWIRRICEDEEAKQRNNKGLGRAAATAPTDVLYVAVVEQGRTPQIFHCQRGKVIREIADIPSEIDVVIRECIERARPTSKESEQNW